MPTPPCCRRRCWRAPRRPDRGVEAPRGVATGCSAGRCMACRPPGGVRSARPLHRVRRPLAEGEAIVAGEMSLVLEAALQRDAEHGGRSVGRLQHLARVMEPNPLDVFLRGEAAGLLEALEQGAGVDVGGLGEAVTLSGWSQCRSTNCLTVSTVEAAGEVSGGRLASVKSMQAATSPITSGRCVEDRLHRLADPAQFARGPDDPEFARFGMPLGRPRDLLDETAAILGVDAGDQFLERGAWRGRRQIEQRPKACRADSGLRAQILGPERKTGSCSGDVVGAGPAGE